MIKIAILTPLQLEREAVVQHLSNGQQVRVNGDLVYVGKFAGKNHEFEVIVKQTGSGNSVNSSATERLINNHKPNLLFLTGIAGGVKDVALGDVVVGKQAHNYESGKETAEGIQSRPKSYWSNQTLISLAEEVSEQNIWQKRNPLQGKAAQVFFGPIASGEKVVATIDQATYTLIKAYYNDTLAIEMEAHGVGQTMHHHANIHWINVRGISDMLVGKNADDDLDTQPFAAAQAAAFLFEMLYQINFSELNIPIMDAKELSKAVYGILFPVTRLESVKEIGKDLTDATNGTIRELWEKVKPLFVEEMEELEADPTDEDNQAAIKAKLTRVLKKEQNADLKIEVEEKVKKIAEEEGKDVSVYINNSKNVVAGSNITVGGDFRLGDG